MLRRANRGVRELLGDGHRRLGGLCCRRLTDPATMCRLLCAPGMPDLRHGLPGSTDSNELSVLVKASEPTESLLGYSSRRWTDAILDHNLYECVIACLHGVIDRDRDRWINELMS